MSFGTEEVQAMKKHFSQNHYADAITQVVKDVGIALQFHFPFNRETDKNELPDEIIFGEVDRRTGKKDGTGPGKLPARPI